jgi:F-type H+-transporting ATPase subunit epsilon
MPDEFQLRIVTPRRKVLDEPVLEVTAPGTLGEFGVLPNHVTFLSSLEIGRLSYRGQHDIAVRGGFAEVKDNVMTVLADAAEPAPEVDAGTAREQLRSTETALTHLSPADPTFEAIDSDRRWAEARIEVAGK